MNLKKGKFLGAIVLSLFLLSSCRSLKNTNTLFLSEYDKFADTAKTVFVANETLENSKNYKISLYDKLIIRNLQNPEGLVNTSKTDGTQEGAVFQVDKDGVVILPVIGSLNVYGLTRQEAAAQIQELYSKKLFKNPIIDVSVINLKVTLLGEVARPGNYMLEEENVNLLEIIAESGGFMSTADPKKVKIIRGNLQSPEIIYVNLKNLNSLRSDKLALRNNDIIYISPRGLTNLSEGIKSYSIISQPVFVILNIALLLYTIRR